jgi:hypothetical protein
MMYLQTKPKNGYVFSQLVCPFLKAATPTLQKYGCLMASVIFPLQKALTFSCFLFYSLCARGRISAMAIIMLLFIWRRGH